MGLVYFDSSAFVKLVVEEDGSDAVHLASQLAVGAAETIFAVWDQRLRAGAKR